MLPQISLNMRLSCRSMHLRQTPRFRILAQRYRIIWIHVVTTEQIGGKFGDEPVGVYTSKEGAFTLITIRVTPSR
jgi:hypothetical protein